MQIIKIYPRGFASNSYLVTADGKTAVCIDPSQERVLDEAKKRGLTIIYVLLTHGHFDHIGGCALLQKQGAKIGCLDKESDYVTGDLNRSLSLSFGESFPPFTVDFTVRDGEEFTLCDVPFKAIATPGHTAGSACFLSGESMFVGDTLFYESVGRVDLPTGSATALTGSVKKLYAMEGDYTLYSGHGEETTLEHERKYNGFIRA